MILTIPKTDESKSNTHDQGDDVTGNIHGSFKN
jgi:hypothetical protein